MTKILDSLKLQEVKKILQDLRIYADMTKKLGQRGSELFQRNLSQKQKLVVEYFPVFGEDDAWHQAQQVFKKSFALSPERIGVLFIPKESIKGGMKVYVDDQMVDMSFTKVERLLQK